MTVASKELCERLHELSGWETGTTGFCYSGDMLVFGWTNDSIPAYDLGFLLRKLPYKVKDEYQSWQYGHKLMPTASTGWKIWFGEIGKDSETHFTSADTPEDAAAKLCIELIESGDLKP